MSTINELYKLKIENVPSGSICYKVYLDDKEIKVIDLQLRLTATEVPHVILTVPVSEIDIEDVFTDVKIIKEEKIKECEEHYNHE